MMLYLNAWHVRDKIKNRVIYKNNVPRPWQETIAASVVYWLNFILDQDYGRLLDKHNYFHFFKASYIYYMINILCHRNST